MRLDKASAEWQQGLTDFLDSTFGGSSKGGTAPCPCSACRSMSFRKWSDVQKHLLRKGFDESFIREQESICEGLGIDDDDDVDDRAGTQEMLHSLIRERYVEKSMRNIQMRRQRNSLNCCKRPRRSCFQAAQKQPKCLSLSECFR